MRYKGFVKAKEGYLLLGGVPQHTSFPFDNPQDALDWTESAVESNIKADRMVEDSGIIPVS